MHKREKISMGMSFIRSVERCVVMRGSIAGGQDGMIHVGLALFTMPRNYWCIYRTYTHLCTFAEAKVEKFWSTTYSHCEPDPYLALVSLGK